MTPATFEQFNTPSGSAARTAIVFVHGFSGDLRRTWGRIPELLEASGRLPGWDLFGFGYSSRRRFDLLGLWSADPALKEIALKLTSTLGIDAKNYKLAFVAHSMGGLVVQRALANDEKLRNRTTHVVMFGTPSGGLSKAGKVSWLKQQARDMAVGGDFVTALRKDWKEMNLDSNPPFHFRVVAGEMDQFVDPHSSLDPFPQSIQQVIPGNHISMLAAESVDAPCVKMILESLTQDAAGSGARSAASVAVDAGEFQELINRLWPGRDKLDDHGAIQLAIALDRKGRRDDAIDLLRAHKPSGTDVLGVLAGRLKRRWLVTNSAEDFTSAVELYRKGFEQSAAKDHAQAYYHGINLAYLSLAGDPRDRDAARNFATAVLQHCAKAAETEIPQERHWRLASEGDALVILQRTEEGFQKHREAASLQPGPKAWEALSMEEQALRVAELAGLTVQQGQALAAIYEG